MDKKKYKLLFFKNTQMFSDDDSEYSDDQLKQEYIALDFLEFLNLWK